MREIKFRAWHKEKKKIILISSLHFYDDGKTNYGYKETPNVPNVNVTISEDEAVLMEFTGLQDENGVDIYEGDIINLSYEYFDGHFRDNEIVGKVYFEDSSFRMSYKKYDEIREWRIDEPEILSIEVIGNIYENPELLVV